MSSSTIRATSCMAPNSQYIMRAVIDYLRQRTALKIQLVEDLPWPERLHQLKHGAIDLGWICGAQYSQDQQAEQRLQCLAAPVWRGAAYANEPIYHSVVVVRRDSAYQSFADLRGATWVYNEPNSFSGSLIVLDHLVQIGEGGNYFGQQIEAGSHQQAVEQIDGRKADVAAIDSTVWEQLCDDDPTVATNLRIITRLGPNPIPPWVTTINMPIERQQLIRRSLLTMATEEEGRRVLAQTPLRRFAAITPERYLHMHLVTHATKGLRDE